MADHTVAGSETADGLEADLADLHDQIDRIVLDATSLLDGLTEAQATWRPAPGRWSVAECLEHLNQTAERYLPAIDAAIGRGAARNLTSAGPFRYGWLGKWFARLLEPPPRRAFKAPGGFAPASDLSVSSVTRAFFEKQTELQARIHRAHGLDLARIKVTSPVSRFIRFELGQCLAVVTAHERRHLWQAWRVTEEPGFPR